MGVVLYEPVLVLSWRTYIMRVWTLHPYLVRICSRVVYTRISPEYYGPDGCLVAKKSPLSSRISGTLESGPETGPLLPIETRIHGQHIGLMFLMKIWDLSRETYFVMNPAPRKRFHFKFPTTTNVSPGVLSPNSCKICIF